MSEKFCSSVKSADSRVFELTSKGRYFDAMQQLLASPGQRTASQLSALIQCMFSLGMGVQAAPHVLALAELQEKTGQAEQALQTLQQGINHDPGNVQIYMQAGMFRQRQGRLADARRCFEKAISLDPMFTPLYNLLGVVLQDMDLLDESVVVLRRAVLRQPDFVQAWLNLGTALMRLHRIEEAEHCYQQALRFNPDYTHARSNLGMCQLWQGKHREGWANYEARYLMPAHLLRVKSPTFPVPRWQGESLIGRRVLIWPEQGLGDQMMCAAWLGPLQQQCQIKQLVLACARPLLPLFGRLSGPDLLVDVYDAMPLCDLWLGAMSVPHALLQHGYDITAIPAWLSADMRWLPPVLHSSPRLLVTGKRRIGLCWKGSAAYPGDAQRSFALDVYRPLLSLPDIELVTLLPNTRVEFLQWAGARALDMGHDIDATSPPFEETAAVMMALDLIITSDTSIAHLAVALGKPVWLMLQYAGEWRWSVHPGRGNGHLRIFRQSAPGDWAGLMQSVLDELS